jgi:hypothetical protein
MVSLSSPQSTQESGAGPSSGTGRKAGSRKGKVACTERATPGQAAQRETEAKLAALLERFAPTNWNKDRHTHCDPPLSFTGPEPGCTHPYGRLPSLPGLFDKFWTPKMQRKIVKQSNRYALEMVDDVEGKTRGGLHWKPLTLSEFRAYISICLFMGVKKLPSTRSYWTNNSLLHCPIISQLMIRNRFEQITRCLHVVHSNH